MRIVLGLLLALAPAAASAVTIGDASFENPQISGGYQYNPAGTPWTFLQTSGIASNGGPFYGVNAPDGTQAAFIQSGSGNIGKITQTLTGLTIGTTYTFSFQEAGRPGTGANTIDVSFAGLDLGSSTPTSTAFLPQTTSRFTATSTSGLLSFTGLSSNADITTVIDLVSINVSLNDTAIPEPASLLLLVVGLGAVGAVRRLYSV